MPPKRSAATRTPKQLKLEDVVPADSVKLESDDSTSEPSPRRSLRKRRRVDTHDAENADDFDDESSLTSLEPSEYEDMPSSTTGLGLAKFAYSSSRPSRAVKTPSKAVKLEDVPVDAALDVTKPKTSTRKASASSSPSKKSANPSPRKKKGIVMELDTPHPTPPNWERQYQLIQEMRANVQAPVDTMGCCKSMNGEGELKDQRFGTLVSLMLSSQTRDEITGAAMANLRRVLPGGLTIQSLLAADPSVISGAIQKVGFWRRKTEYIRTAAATLRDKFDGDVPKTIDELCSLQGVGPKMAFLVLQVAWNINAGIGVDVHVHRITNRLGWHKPPTTTPEQTRLNLQSWLPRELHKPINPLLVGFGQVICLPVGPRCDSCTLATEGLCPSARVNATAKGRKPIIYKPKVEPKNETPDAPDLDVTGLIRVEDEVKKEDESQHDASGPLVQIKYEE